MRSVRDMPGRQTHGAPGCVQRQAAARFLATVRSRRAFSSRMSSLFPLGSTLRRREWPRRCAARGTHGSTLRSAADQGDAGAAERSALRPLELDQGPLVVEDRAQLGILRGGEIALRLQDEEVRRL